MRVALKFGYDGTAFQGYHRQKGLRTVEGELIKALKSAWIIADEKKANFGSASRTDKGVSAIGNVISFNTDFKAKNILPNLNAKYNNIWLWGIAIVPEDFNPRHVERRWYRYCLPPFFEKKLIEEGSKLFVGTHDFKSYTKRAEEDTVRTIDSITVRKQNDFIMLDFKAQSFLWNMVRRIVSALLRLESRSIRLEDIRESLKGEKRFNFGLASAEELVLMDVSHDISFEVDEDVLKTLTNKLDKALFKLKLKKTFFEDLKVVISEGK